MYTFNQLLITLKIIRYLSINFRSRGNPFFFYFQRFSDNRANYFVNLFENMNTGFLSIKGNKIVRMNSYLIKKLSKYRSNIEKYNPMSNRNNTDGKLNS